jgi:hypothetical protein
MIERAEIIGLAGRSERPGMIEIAVMESRGWNEDR